MKYGKFKLMAELGKLSQDKPTILPACVVATQAIDRLRAMKKDGDEKELFRLYRM